jgi:hypothetical protein
MRDASTIGVAPPLVNICNSWILTVSYSFETKRA